MDRTTATGPEATAIAAPVPTARVTVTAAPPKGVATTGETATRAIIGGAAGSAGGTLFVTVLSPMSRDSENY